VVAVDEETEACDIKFVDYGGYSTVNSSVLRQIRGDFMTLPFQAVECYLANVMPFGGTKHLLDQAVNNNGMNRCRIYSEF
jgi:hypothetical protein